MTATKPTVYGVYCDESRQTGSFKFRLVGSIWIPVAIDSQFVTEYLEFCDSQMHMRPGHLKFSKTPNPSCHYYKFYKRLVDMFFQYRAAGMMTFRAVIVDQSYQFDHPWFNEGDYDLGFYKLYYQLLVHPIRIRWWERYHVRLAQRPVAKGPSGKSEENRLAELRQCLNATVWRYLGYPDDDDWKPPVLSVESRSARDSLPIQLADILMGAVGFHWNGEHLKPHAKVGKVHLSNYIATRLRKPDLCFQSLSPLGDDGFNIFYHRP